ncbi:MAG: aspartate/glutamate racemase family protein [Acidimicrobiales bacterium]|nr:aspartate/glutamate racemase family protein [Acidimicrobiales bacterium]
MTVRPSDQVQRFAFSTDEGVGPRALLGLIVLETDRTVEAEVRSLHLDGVAHHVSRIPMDATVTTETLRAMEARIPVAAGLLPPVFGFDAIGYACTSGATLIGAEQVAAAVGLAHPGVPCTDPISAALAAFRTLDIRSIGLLTPYNAEVTLRMGAHYQDRGIEVAAVGSFLEEDDNVVGRITEASVADAVRRIGSEPGCDAVFVSCTSLRTFGVLAGLEAELGRPVVSSNQAFAWHLHRLAGVQDAIPGLGTLFERGLPT